MTGKRAWQGHPTLSRPLTIMGVERTWFVLSGTLGLAMWNAINSLLTGAVIFLVLYALGLLAWRKDPNMLSIVKASAESRTRYDAGKPGRWHLDLLE